MVVEDSKKINSMMNGEEVKVSEFVSTFRRSLLSEHLGLPENEVIDPLSIEFTNRMNTITEVITLRNNFFNLLKTGEYKNF